MSRAKLSLSHLLAIYPHLRCTLCKGYLLSVLQASAERMLPVCRDFVAFVGAIGCAQCTYMVLILPCKATSLHRPMLGLHAQ